MRDLMLSLIFLFGIGLAAMSVIPHYEWFQKPRDMEDVRRQLHLPADADFVQFDSGPKSIRPEGLRIEATVQFSEPAFAAYVTSLDDRQIWKPVAFLDYSPAIGEEYGPAALAWHPLPIETSLATRLRNWRIDLPRPADPTAGKIYCSVLHTAAIGRWEHNPAAFKWKTFGKSCTEMGESEWPTVTVVAVLDSGARRLHVRIRFSG